MVLRDLNTVDCAARTSSELQCALRLLGEMVANGDNAVCSAGITVSCDTLMAADGFDGRFIPINGSDGS